MKFKDKTLTHVRFPKCGLTTFQEATLTFLDKKLKFEDYNKKLKKELKQC